MDSGTVFIIFVIPLIIILFLILYVGRIITFIYDERDNFPELNLGNYLDTIIDFDNIQIWISKYRCYKAKYERETYVSSPYYPNFSYYGIPSGEDLFKYSRIARIPIPHDKIKADVDKYYIDCKKKYETSKMFNIVAAEILNELIESADIDFIDHDIIAYYIEQKDSNKFKSLIKELRDYYDCEHQNINNEGKDKIRQHFIKYKNNDPDILLVKIIMDVQRVMQYKGLLAKELDIDHDKIFKEILNGAFSYPDDNFFKQEHIRMIYEYFMNNQTKNEDEIMKNMINEANTKILEGEINVYASILEKIIKTK